DLANLVNEAAILAARRNKKKIGMPEFEEAVDRVQMGPERKSRVISPDEKQRVAYHEAGHAVVAFCLPDFDPLHKVTIVARGMAGGYTMALPQEDRTLYTKTYLEKRIAFALGGHAAEELRFGEFTTGPSDDISKVTQIARSMVTRYGMSERLGPRTFGRKEELVFLGREISEQRDYSDKIAEEIDDEVRVIIDEAHERARKILTENRDKLELLSQRLMDEETLDGDRLIGLLSGEIGDSGSSLPPSSSLPSDQQPRVDEQPPLPKPRTNPKPGLAWGSSSSQVNSSLE
ncbi:MAG: ATP-dependent zinc metalloprotease FtsH, partial [Dehalococcoidia bacterium]